MKSAARAFWVTGPARAEIRDESLPEPGPGEVLVQALYSAVSRGTESLVFLNRVPESEHRRMRCPHQAGDFPAPVKYGYASVGRVLEGSTALRDRLVFCLYPHQSLYVVPERAVVPLPDAVPAERAVLAANLETCINACWDAPPMLGDRVSIVGAGVIGCLTAYLMRRIPGIDVQLVDLRAERESVASSLGVRFATPEAADGERDLVVHASAAVAGLRTALGLAAADTSVLELSWFGDAEVPLPLGQAFHARRLGLRASQVGSLSPTARPRWSQRGRLELALALSADPVLDALFTEEGAFEALPESMARLASPSSSALCHRVHYH